MILAEAWPTLANNGWHKGQREANKQACAPRRERERERERERSITPSSPKADSGAARTSPGRSQKMKQCASRQRIHRTSSNERRPVAGSVHWNVSRQFVRRQRGPPFPRRRGGGRHSRAPHHRRPLGRARARRPAAMDADELLARQLQVTPRAGAAGAGRAPRLQPRRGATVLAALWCQDALRRGGCGASGMVGTQRCGAVVAEGSAAAGAWPELAVGAA